MPPCASSVTGYQSIVNFFFGSDFLEAGGASTTGSETGSETGTGAGSTAGAGVGS